MRPNEPQISINRVAWIGRTDSEFGWLKEQVEATHDVEPFANFDNFIATPRSHNVQRIIATIEDRLSYPIETCEQIQRDLSEIPIAFAASNWWDGSRRTGMLSRPAPVIPWHRWWDNWQPWLAGNVPQMLEPCAKHFESTASCGTKKRQLPPSPTGVGLVVSNRTESAETWQIAAAQMGWHVKTRDPQSIASSLSDDNFDYSPDWILWDDSSFDSFKSPSSHESLPLFQQLARLKSEFSAARQLFAFSMPRWDLWQTAMHHGADAFLTKPSSYFSLKAALA